MCSIGFTSSYNLYIVFKKFAKMTKLIQYLKGELKKYNWNEPYSCITINISHISEEYQTPHPSVDTLKLLHCSKVLNFEQVC